MFVELRNAIIGMREDEALVVAQRMTDAGVEPSEVLDTARDALTELGRQFEAGEAFIPELVMGAEIFRAIAAELKPRLGEGSAPATRGTVVLGTVAGDIHDLGKGIVQTMLGAAGFEVVDLGVDVAAGRFMEEARQRTPCIVALSGLLTVVFDSMKKTVDALDEAGLRQNVRVMIGGAPVDESVCRYVGADGWGDDAVAAVRLASQWTDGGAA